MVIVVGDGFTCLNVRQAGRCEGKERVLCSDIACGKGKAHTALAMQMLRMFFKMRVYISIWMAVVKLTICTWTDSCSVDCCSRYDISKVPDIYDSAK